MLGILEYHMDYCFLGDEFDRLTLLVLIERYTKIKKAVVVPSNRRGGMPPGWSSSSSTSAGTRTRTSL